MVVAAPFSFLANPSNKAFSIGSVVTIHYLILKITNSNPEKKMEFFWRQHGYLFSIGV